MAPAQIRVHKYEAIIAVRWPHDDRWLMVWPTQPQPTVEWRPRSFPDTDLDTDLDTEHWVDPAADTTATSAAGPVRSAPTSPRSSRSCRVSNATPGTDELALRWR